MSHEGDFPDEYTDPYINEFSGEFSDKSREASPPVEIPAEQLSAQALEGILENFIVREGTDYGTQEVSHEAKLDRVLKQLERGDVKIVFDPDSESVTLMTKTEWNKLSGTN